jgi:hypothetical protein
MARDSEAPDAREIARIGQSSNLLATIRLSVACEFASKPLTSIKNSNLPLRSTAIDGLLDNILHVVAVE